MVERDYLFIPNKMEEYLLGEKPDVDCILCAIVEGDEKVVSLEVCRDELFLVSANLYPYNSGHLIVFPLRHIAWPGELTEEEALRLHYWQTHILDTLKQTYPVSGFNIGYNLGKWSGASIPHHMHLHIVPRFQNELGFISVLAGTHIMVEDPHKTVERLRHLFSKED